MEFSAFARSQNLKITIVIICLSTYNILNRCFSDLTDERIPLVVWQTCAFTIHASVWQGEL